MDGIDFRVFDIQVEKGKYADWVDVVDISHSLGLEVVPVLYQGKYDPVIIKHRAEANSTICPSQISEGVVVRCEKETKLPSGERKQLKLLSSAYVLRDDSKENAE